jgi:hypothetical protein
MGAGENCSFHAACEWGVGYAEAQLHGAHLLIAESTGSLQCQAASAYRFRGYNYCLYDTYERPCPGCSLFIDASVVMWIQHRPTEPE